VTWLLAVSVFLAITVLSIVPLAVLAVIHADNLLESLARTRRRARKARERVLPEPVGPPLEKIATDLRRIASARRETSLGSLGYTILTTQYDKQLANGCRALGIDHQIYDLCGFDLDMERLRVEGALSEAGMVLADSDVEQDVDG
jgi:heme exporter protein D